MASMPKSGFLRKAFASAVLGVTVFTGVGLAMAPAASAAPVKPTGPVAASVVDGGAVLGAQTVFAKGGGAERAREARQDRAAIAETIVSATDGNIMNLVERGVLTQEQVAYVHDSIADMNLPASTQAGDLNADQTSEFMQHVKDRQAVAIVSAPTVERALELGLAPEYAEFFAESKAANGVTAETDVTVALAQGTMESMKGSYFDHNTQPKILAGVGAAGVVAAGGAAAALISKRRNSGPQPG